MRASIQAAGVWLVLALLLTMALLLGFVLLTATTLCVPAMPTPSLTRLPYAAAGGYKAAMNNERILLVDDDPGLRDLLTRYLAREGYEVKAAAEGNAAKRALDQGHYDLIVLDLMLPGEDGLSLLRRWRGEGVPTPVIMLTAKGDEIDRIVGLELGADDVIEAFEEVDELDDPDERAFTTDGRPLPGVDLKVVDFDGASLPPGEAGKLLVRSVSNFGGYLKRPQWNGTDAEGWFDTGDLARIDAQGYVRITGRSKDVIIRGGENIPVVEIESLLYRHPAVSLAAIVAYPDERLGERACAVIVPKPGQTIDLPAPRAEHEALAELKAMASQNRLSRSFIGMGYADTLTPAVILRNVLENPGWYTAYTPYQAEIAQGRLEALLNYQQVIIDLTGLPLANASLLDEATAAAEAMAMARRVSTSKSNRFFVDSQVWPQTLDVLKTRAAPFGFELVLGTPDQAAAADVFGALFQYPNAQGAVSDLTDTLAAVKATGAVTVVAADLMALALLKSPGEMGADIALGSAQRFGVPMGFGGPHAAYFASRDALKRAMPGRIIGVSVDANGKPALRMALQTREQHIRREKANSNISFAAFVARPLPQYCTAPTWVWNSPLSPSISVMVTLPMYSSVSLMQMPYLSALVCFSTRSIHCASISSVTTISGRDPVYFHTSGLFLQW